MFYVYIYLDPRKKGLYNYLGLELDYEPFYVGKGKGDRINKHLCKNKLRKNTYKNNKIKEIFKSELKPIILKFEDELIEEDAFKLEKYLIKIIGRHDLSEGPLTNKTAGGEGFSGLLITEETKKKISESLRGRIVTIETREKLSNSIKGKKQKPFSEETKRKISLACKGDKNGFYNKQHSKKTKDKISKKLKGKSTWNKDIPMSEETKRKISKSQSGKIPWNKLSEQEREKRKKKRRKMKWQKKKQKKRNKEK